MFKNNLLKDLGDLRDGLIVLSGIVYIIGYASWSLLAWANGYGFVPALEPQYFAAGLPPVIIIICLVIVIRYLRRLIEDIAPNLAARYPNLSQKLNHRIIYLFVGVISLIAYIFILYIALLSRNHLWSLVIFFLLFILVVSIRIFLISMISPLTRLPTQKIWNAIMFYFLLPCLAAYSLIIYAIDLYPKIPQQIGGARPRFAQVDLLVDNMSKQTLAELVDSTTMVQGREVQRSKMVSVVFSGGGSLLLQGQSKVKGAPPTVLEIKKEAVTAVKWYGH